MTFSSPTAGAGPVLAAASETAVVAAPVAAVDLATWIMTLSNDDYRQCAPGEHKGCGASKTPDGRPMSICTEMVGGNLMIQHYVGEVMTPSRCRMVSLTDVFASSKWTTVEVIWGVCVVSDGADRCVFTNSITSRATPDFLAALNASASKKRPANAWPASAITTGVRRRPSRAASRNWPRRADHRLTTREADHVRREDFHAQRPHAGTDFRPVKSHR